MSDDEDFREFIQQIMDERWTAHRDVHTAERRELDIARAGMESRLDRLNKLRAEVLDDRSQFIRLDAYEEKHEALRQRIDQLEGWRLRATGIFLVLVPLAGLIGAAIAKAFHV